MSDNAHIFIPEADAFNLPDDQPVRGIYLHTHGAGEEWPTMLRMALATERAQDAIRDQPYLTRIVIDELYRYDRDKLSGGGNSTHMVAENDWPITVLDVSNGFVHYAVPGEETDAAKWYGGATFEYFLKLSRPRHENVADYR